MAQNSRPLVSVVIPAYNASKYLDDAVDSILSQTYNNIEVIIIDDKSTDNTAKLALAYCKRDKRVRVILNKENIGIGGNRTKGIKQSRGQFVCWQDADDISLPDRIQKQVDYLTSHPRAGVVGGWLQFFDKNGDGAVRRYAEDDKTLRSKIFLYNPIAQPASMFRADCFKSVGGYSEKYRVSEDLEMLFRVGEKYQFGNIQSVVLRYRQSGTSLTASNLKRMELATFEIRNHYKRSSAYHYTLGDALYNFAQKLSIYMPKSLRMAVFKIIRGDS